MIVEDNKRIFGSAVVRNVTMDQGFGIDGMLLCMTQAYARSIEIDNHKYCLCGESSLNTSRV